MNSPVPRATRGHGILEGLLARARSDKARSLLYPTAIIDSVLDIGCGSFPLFLSKVNVEKRVGLERHVEAELRTRGIQLIAHDIISTDPLPFPDSSFKAVTMLAVIEHVPFDVAVRLVREVRRVLYSEGIFVVTTPAAWTDGILRTMARLRLVSPEEIDEHAQTYSRESLRGLFLAGGFQPEEITIGSFELGMNLWAKAVKQA
ncbi:MAG: class I SAM-dependent methyltransferase [Candidatus Hydrogenedentes bacterium]|nr:class I SAM-dependent methyltransferase [Candidatus Hydrogenedentota bacterium]